MTNDTPHILQVALPVGLPRLFDYLPPSGASIAPGSLVQVPFQRRRLVGVVMAVANTSDFAVDKLRPIEAMLGDGPLLSENDLALARWMAEYYVQPIGEVLMLFVPSLMRQGEVPPCLPSYQFNQANSYTKKLTAKQQALKDWAESIAAPFTLSAAKMHGFDQTTAQALMERDIIVPCQNPWCIPDSLDEPVLTDEQQAACESLNGTTFKISVLQGITGSGKTEVYLRLMADAIRRGNQVMYVVPEIGLTPQTIDRLQKRLGVPIAVTHSQLTDVQRTQVWQEVAQGQVPVVVGTRSCIFNAMPKLGMIIIDEEHDGSFKEHSGSRYHARDVAAMRAKQSDIPLVLGSATPSLESCHNADRGRYQRVWMRHRVGQAKLPTCAIHDLRGKKASMGLDHYVREHIRSALEAGEQAMVFLNRRGYAPVWFCQDCGWHAKCRDCDVNMTYHHHKQQLRCHHCGAQSAAPKQCPDCQCEPLAPVGFGTERIEEELGSHFPDWPLVRLDRDTVKSVRDLQQSLAQIRKNEPMMILGTQMLAKGHDFPRVTRVIVLGIDHALISADFRALERLMQLVIQVAGRAGRADRPGQVVIPTHWPNHPVMRYLNNWDYEGWARGELAQRQACDMPPTRHAVALQLDANQPDLPMSWLHQLAVKHAMPGVELLGPAPAFIAKKAGRYRAELWVLCDSRVQRAQWIATALCHKSSLPSTARLVVDVDPIEFC